MSTQLLAWLINATVATSIASIAILLLRKPLQRLLGAEIAYRLWVALPLAAFAAGFSMPKALETPTSPAPAIAQAAPAVVVEVTRTLRSLDADRWLLGTWLLGTWLLGACALVAVFAWQQRRFVARLRLRRDRDGQWRAAASHATPAVLGVLRQKLVLPERFEADYDHDERAIVLAHETMHQRRRDPWALAACAGLRVVFWFNPLLHAAAARFRRDVELACDAAVLRTHPASRRRYADALLKTHLAGDALPVGCLWHDTPPMKERIMLLKNAFPARRARLAGAILVGLAALGAAGLALAGHDTATAAAGALAAATAPAVDAPAYRVKLVMSVDGKPVGHPTVVTRAGETAMIKLDDNGVAWGFRFTVQPLANGRFALTGDVVSGRDDRVIGHSRLEDTAGKSIGIAVPSGGRTFNVDAQVIAVDHLDRIPEPAMPEEGAAAPAGQHREVRIVNGGPGDTADADRAGGGTPALDQRREIRVVTGSRQAHPDDADIDIENDLTGDTAAPDAHREVRETRKCSPPDAQGHKRCTVEREVRVAAPGAATPALAPLPPLPPAARKPVRPTPALRPMALRAPPAPPAPPAPMLRGVPTPPPAPPVALTPPAPLATPAPMALPTPMAPPAPPAPLAARGLTPPPAPPAPPLRLARNVRAPVALPAPAPRAAIPQATPPAPPATPAPVAAPEAPEPPSN